MKRQIIYGSAQQVFGGTQMTYKGILPVAQIGKGVSRFNEFDKVIKGKRSAYDLYHESKGKVNLSFKMPGKKK